MYVWMIRVEHGGTKEGGKGDKMKGLDGHKSIETIHKSKKKHITYVCRRAHL
jgi:hypothetical protein